MIRLIDNYNDLKMYDFLMIDQPTNYFLLVGINSNKDPFSQVYVLGKEDYKAVIFVRKSKTIQLFYNKLTKDEKNKLIAFIKQLKLSRLILTSEQIKYLDLENYYENKAKKAYIMKLDTKIMNEFEVEENKEVILINENKLEDILDLYNETFESYSPVEVLKGRFIRGLYYGIYSNEELISSAALDFCNMTSCLLVGVATKEKERNKGLATSILKRIINNAIIENKNLYLQFDNPIAGKIYENLGFVNYLTVFHITR
jgi:hypothetical protein